MYFRFEISKFRDTENNYLALKDECPGSTIVPGLSFGL